MVPGGGEASDALKCFTVLRRGQDGEGSNGLLGLVHREARSILK